MKNTNQIPGIKSIQPVEPITHTKNKNIFKILFFISIFISITVIIGVYFLLNNKIKQLENKQVTDITSIPTSIPTIIPTTTKILTNPTLTEVDQTKELTNAINPTNKSNIEVYVTKIIGDYATGQIHDTNGGGAGWIAVKIKGVWKKVDEGQDGPSCSIVEQYQIPKEIYGNCDQD